ncbi:uncharacterized protein A1O5_01028 [Cladophialophora psammophila CBS 110553]|uniref:VOC domain-containing protein n=1 Tax=Cladophialophora psammophila CBS 110553 TaxID=1182543 RepID=W9XGQ5_9EURO|nr:uncharacterized protein A1O5_01028 [Cladophialophora psammophila CBS 110553]EXJ76520.1 hypothetical protein A1O5_01028 [Cladophialophora psammophila CBS 110553]
MGSITDKDSTKHSVEVQMSPRPSPIGLAHIVLRSTPTSYRKMVTFYQELLNGEIILEEKTFAFLRYDYEHHRVGILMTPETQAKDGSDVAGLEHVSFTFATLTAMARVYQHLKSLGHEPYWAVNHGMTSSMYYRDPERNKVEIQIENFDTPAEADAFVRGPLFRENPVGTDIDPPAWAERILSKMTPDGEEGLSGEEIRDIKVRKEIGPRHEIPWVALAP